MCAKFLCKKCTFNSTFILSINQSSILHQLQPHFICNFIANEKLLNNYLTLIRNKHMNKNYGGWNDKSGVWDNYWSCFSNKYCYYALCFNALKQPARR